MSQSESRSEPRSEYGKTENKFAFQFYGRRVGRPLSHNQRRLMADILPLFQLTRLDGYKNLSDLFNAKTQPHHICLEIGFGGGEHLAEMARANPNTGFIGAEPFINGIVSLLRVIEAENLTNILIWPDDVRPILPLLPAQSLAAIYVMFPDPWPKSRHAGRRIINQPILDQLARCLISDGMLRMASDHPIAKEWLLAESTRHPDFYWTAKTPNDWRIRPQNCPQTRYMKKGVEQGRAISWFDFKKRSSK